MSIKKYSAKEVFFFYVLKSVSERRPFCLIGFMKTDWISEIWQENKNVWIYFATPCNQYKFILDQQNFVQLSSFL
jgi:hypothetical protein